MRENEGKSNQQNNNNYSNPKSNTITLKKSESTAVRKHSETPIPKILTTLHQKNQIKDRQYQSPNGIAHSSSTNHSKNMQAPSTLSNYSSSNK